MRARMPRTARRTRGRSLAVPPPAPGHAMRRRSTAASGANAARSTAAQTPAPAPAHVADAVPRRQSAPSSEPRATSTATPLASVPAPADITSQLRELVWDLVQEALPSASARAATPLSMMEGAAGPFNPGPILDVPGEEPSGELAPPAGPGVRSVVTGLRAKIWQG